MLVFFEKLMTHTLSVYEGENLFVVKTNGAGDVGGIIAFIEDVVSHSEWRSGMSILVDHRELELHEITQAGVGIVSRFFQSVASQLGDGKLALVMNRDVDFGIARAWEAITSDNAEMDIFVFRDFDRAIAWLGVESVVL